jgi:two-component system response regulator HydG
MNDPMASGGEPAEPAPPPEPGSRGRVLVVEDDQDTARFEVEVLRLGGFDVTHTPDPAEALRRAGEDWDLVVTDLQMPGMSGLELLEALRRVAPDLPVAVVTAYATVNNVVVALRSRADEFLQKPLLPDKLLATAVALVAKGRAAREAARVVVLAIGAHPSDAEAGAAGTLAAHRDRGHEIALLTLCRGARDGEQDRRAAHAREAAEILGATLYLEDLENARISEGDPTTGIIGDVVAAIRPTVVYTHSMRDVDSDHRNAHRAAMVAIRTIGRVYCYQSPSATVDFRPTRFVGIDRQLDRKLGAIAVYAESGEAHEDMEPDLIRAMARSWSRFADGRYAEPFEVVRDRADVAAGQSAHVS